MGFFAPILIALAFTQPAPAAQRHADPPAILDPGGMVVTDKGPPPCPYPLLDPNSCFR